MAFLRRNTAIPRFTPAGGWGANNNNVFSRCCKASEYASG